MTRTGWVVVFVALFHFGSAVSAVSISTRGNLWAHKATFDNKVTSNVSSNVFLDVIHPMTCMETCTKNSACGAFFYSESEAKCVTCPYPCQENSFVTARGFRYYTLQRMLQCPTQMGYYHYNDTDVCLKVYTDLRTQQDAQLVCQLDGGHLFDFNTKQELANLRDYIPNFVDTSGLQDPIYLWLGASDEVTEDVWLWTDGTLATDTLSGEFDNLQPSGGTRENGLTICQLRLLLHDTPSTTPALYVCEIDLS